MPRLEHGSVILHKERSLGSGAFGEVCLATCGELLCAAKIIHSALINAENSGAVRQLEMFEQECGLLSQVKHPNIVQYLDTRRDSIPHPLVLLMELCDCNLTSYLERSAHPLLYCTQVNICHDIARALAYLHTNDVIHRDLTSNNVLLVGGRAKVTDFGTSKLLSQAKRLTTCPGNAYYMPPEALREPPEYTQKLDCFSWGVLVIQILTRKFPEPGPSHKIVRDAKSPVGEKHVPILEEERRESHISLIDPDHPLLPIAKTCLSYHEKKRPSSQDLCKELTKLKETKTYSTEEVPVDPDGCRQEIDSFKKRVEALSQELTVLQDKLTQKDSSLANQESQIEMLKADLQGQKDLVRAREEQLERISEAMRAEVRQALEKQGELTKVKAEHNEVIQGKEKEINNLRLLVGSLQRQMADQSQERKHKQRSETMAVALQSLSTIAEDSKKAIDSMYWQDGKTAPMEMSRGAAAVHDDTAYFRPAGSKTIHVYQNISGKEQWSSLPECPFGSFSLCIIGTACTTVGGYDNNYTNVLLSLTRNRWLRRFPAMPTPRSLSAVAYSEKAVIVAGGRSEAGNLDTVEIMDTYTKQWSAASCVPHPFAIASAAVCGNQLYLTGGYDETQYSCKCTFVCSLSDPLSPQAWSKVGDISTMRCSLVNLGGNLVAVGGEREPNTYIRKIQCYNPDNNSWSVVGRMKTGRADPLVAVLSSGRLVVVGGVVMDNQLKTDSVEVATLLYKMC